MVVGEFLLSVGLTYRDTSQHFVITSVYRPCNGGRKANFWQELRDASGLGCEEMVDKGISMLRDFFSERTGSKIHIAGMRGFNYLIQSLRIIEPPLACRSYTWTSD